MFVGAAADGPSALASDVTGVRDRRQVFAKGKEGLQQHWKSVDENFNFLHSDQITGIKYRAHSTHSETSSLVLTHGDLHDYETKTTHDTEDQELHCSP